VDGAAVILTLPPFVLSLSKDRFVFERGARKEERPFDKLRVSGILGLV
jgi:hypothetical protein